MIMSSGDVYKREMNALMYLPLYDITVLSLCMWSLLFDISVYDIYSVSYHDDISLNMI